MTYIVESSNAINLVQNSDLYVPEAADAVVLNFSYDYVWTVPVNRPTISVTVSAGFNSGKPTDKSLTIRHGVGDIRDITTDVSFNRADVADACKSLVWSKVPHKDQSSTLAHNNATAKDAQPVELVWSATFHRDSSSTLAFSTAKPCDSSIETGWNTATIVDPDPINLQFYSVDLYGTEYDNTTKRQASIQTDNASTITLSFSEGPYTPEAANAITLNLGYVPPMRRSQRRDISRTLNASQAPKKDASLSIVWGLGKSVWHDYNLRYPVEPNDDSGSGSGGSVDLDIREVYIIMNTANVVVLPDRTPIDLIDISIEYDIDSIAWTLSATVKSTTAMNLIKPTTSGATDIEVDINGNVWVFMIESYTDTRELHHTYRISGASRTKYLSSRYAPARTKYEATAVSAAQMAQEEVANTGFMLTWPTGTDADQSDWTISAGLYSYDGLCAAEVLRKIADTVGAVLIASPDSDELTLQPRYKSPYWELDDYTEEHAIYEGMIKQYTSEFSPGQEIDAVLVSGVESGLALTIELTGSGGVNPGDPVFESWITEQAANIARGRKLISESGNKLIDTITVIIGESGQQPGLLLPGNVISVTHDDSSNDFKGIILSTSISAQRNGGAAAYQTVKIERAA
ncbi:hypothetical protein [Gynuella sp.]|uniref:hypothetical protein n=1 Tax=Gynuella sp. TaxID=2969146 RepID=UPI003D10AC32